MRVSSVFSSLSSYSLVGKLSLPATREGAGQALPTKLSTTAAGRWPDLRRATDSSLWLDAYRRGSYRLTPAMPGLWAPGLRGAPAETPRPLGTRQQARSNRLRVKTASSTLGANDFEELETFV